MDALNITDLVDGIIDAKRNGLEGGIYTGPPQGLPDFPVSDPEALTVEEHRDFWKVYNPKIDKYRSQVSHK